MKYDGSLEIDVDLKVSKAEKSFARLKKKITEGERELEKTARLGDRLAASVRSAARWRGPAGAENGRWKRWWKSMRLNC